MTRVFSGIKPTGPVQLGNLLGALRHWVGRPGRRRHHLLRGRPARPHRAPGPGRAAGPHPRAGPAAPGRRHRPRPVDPLRPEPRARAHRALVDPRVHRRHRRAAAHDPVQGQERGRRVRLRRAVHLSGADGRRHPPLRHRRVPVGDDQRQHVELARDLAVRFNHRYGDTFVVPEADDPDGRRPGDGPAAPARRRCRSRRTRPRARSSCSTTSTSVAKKIKRAVTDTDTEVRYDPDGQARRVEPAVDPRARAPAGTRRRSPTATPATATSRRPPPRPWSRRSGRSRRATPSWPPTPPAPRRSWPRGPTRPAPWPPRCSSGPGRNLGLLPPA